MKFDRTTTAATVARLMPIITVFVALAYAAAFYGLLIMPKIGRLLDGGELDLTGDRARLEEEKSYSKRLTGAVSSYSTLNPGTRSKVENMVTTSPDVPGLYVQLDRLAAASDLQLISVDAVPDEKNVRSGGRRVVRTSINVAGGLYPRFKRFLADIERSERIMDVQSVVFNPATGSYGMVLRTYYVDLSKPAPTAGAAPAASQDGEAP